MAFGSTSSKSKRALKTPVVVEKTEDPFQSELAGGGNPGADILARISGMFPGFGALPYVKDQAAAFWDSSRFSGSASRRESLSTHVSLLERLKSITTSSPGKAAPWHDLPPGEMRSANDS